MNKNCVITGVNGQLGQFLVKYLLENEPDIRIVGTMRHKSYDNQVFIFDKSKIVFELMDLSDQSSIESLIVKYKPEYFINTSANAFVGDSWKVPIQHFELNTIGVLHQLEAIRKHSPDTRYFNMGSSEEFGVNKIGGKQAEDTILAPKSPYGCSKAASRHLVHCFRQSYNLYALQGITFNFESELRGEKYVTKKITQGVARINHALRCDKPFSPIELGNVNSVRSWQYAADVADGIWRMLNQEKYNINFPVSVCADLELSKKFFVSSLKEYVLSSDECHTIKEFVSFAFKEAGIDGKWTGEGENEYFYSLNSYNKDGVIKFVTINPIFFRPNDVTFLNGDSSSARTELGWSPKTSFSELVSKMVKYDIENNDYNQR